MRTRSSLLTGALEQSVELMRGEAGFALIVGFCCLCCVAAAAGPDTDSLREDLARSEGTERVELLNRLAKAVAAQSPSEALALAEQAIILARQLEHRQGEADAYNGRGIARYYLAEYNGALEDYETSLAIAESLHYPKGMANSVNNLGVIYWMWSEYDRAIDYYLRALEIRREMGDDAGIANTLNNLGGVSYASKDFDKALAFYAESLAIYRRLEDQSLIASSLNNIGLVHLDRAEFEVAGDYFSRGQSIAESIGDLSQQAYSLTHLGLVAEHEGRHPVALDRYRQALAAREATGDRRGVAVCEHNIGAVLLKLGQVEASLEHLSTALAIAEEISLKVIERDAHEALSQAYASASDFRGALDHYRRFKEVNDEIFNDVSARSIAQLQTRYELAEKEGEIERLQRQHERQQLVRNATVAGIAGLLLIVVLLYSRYRLTIQASRVMSERNLALENARDEQERAHRLELTHVARLATMGELTAAVTHELNQPLTAILTNARAGQRFFGATPPDLGEVRGALDDIVIGAERTLSLVKRLRELIRRGEISRESLDINQTVIGVGPIVRAEAQLGGVNLKLDLAEGLPPVVGDRVQLQQVLLNLVQNGVAATRENDSVDRDLTVSTTAGDEAVVVVTVRDQGPPVDEVTHRQMFDPFFTTKDEGLGMGLPICRTIIDAHGGKIWAEANQEGGLSVRFSLPIAEEGR